MEAVGTKTLIEVLFSLKAALCVIMSAIIGVTVTSLISGRFVVSLVMALVGVAFFFLIPNSGLPQKDISDILSGTLDAVGFWGFIIFMFIVLFAFLWFADEIDRIRYKKENDEWAREVREKEKLIREWEENHKKNSCNQCK